MEKSHQFISQQISNGSYSLSKRSRGKSIMWSILSEIIKEDGSLVKGWVYCRTCRKTLRCVANCTSNVARHKCCLALKETQVLRTVTAADKEEAMNACAEWIIEDGRPHSTISGAGFMDVARFFIKIGATYGENVDVDDLLPDPTTISRKVHKEAEEKRQIIGNEIRDIVAYGGASATIDLWSDNYLKGNVLGVTLHYERDFMLINIILGLKSMDFEKSSSENIRHKLKALFNQFGIEDIATIKFVTDRNKNLMKALENNTRLNCSSRLFANVLDTSFKQTTELAVIFHTCKEIVISLEKQNKLSTSQQNPCATRCNSNYSVLMTIADNWLNVSELLIKTEETEPQIHIDISTLTTLIELCRDFETVFRKLQVCSSPSLCYVLPSIYKIKRLCDPSTTDIAGISALKKNIKQNIEEIWEGNLTMWHKVAVFLFPPAVGMDRMDIHQIKEFCLAHIKNFEIDNLASSLQTSLPVSNENSLDNSNPASPASASDGSITLQQINRFFFSSLIRNSKETPNESAAREEIERYSVEFVRLTDDFNLIEWWKNNAHSYPRLSKLALQIHSIPASSAAAERAYSLAGNINTDRRNRLDSKSLDCLLFLNSFYTNFGK